MSKKTVGIRSKSNKAKRFKSPGMGLDIAGTGALEEFLKKKLDAKMRLKDNFVVFIRTKTGGIFICGGDVESEFVGHQNFLVALTGYSSGEVHEAKSVIHAITEDWPFSEDDLHPTVVLSSMSAYLKAVMEDQGTSQGLAVEMILIGPSDFIRIYTTGDYQIDNPDELDEDYFIVGCYDDKRKKKLLDELFNLIDPTKEMTDEKMTEVITSLKNKFKLPYVGLRIAEFSS